MNLKTKGYTDSPPFVSRQQIAEYFKVFQDFIKLVLNVYHLQD